MYRGHWYKLITTPHPRKYQGVKRKIFLLVLVHKIILRLFCVASFDNRLKYFAFKKRGF